ncbi:alpha/beta fold hydrolase [Auraticoccus sp. F435]|uniref:Alpha/beta fold hydrolase n=1 Tax=Auraticoccus cholistanensis TaxID=2656650 RepID=A0A6A9UYM1_9ACTN|nr:alpha/beta fold hydrolase [Auraticoccus cholistanensis]MVA76972.1 alpha/beta fold hydrolase [Auraticoccus cholistanensis]
MPRVDLPLDQLLEYRCTTPEPDDLDEFWTTTLAENDHPLDVVLSRVDTGLTLVETYDVTFAGYGGAPIKAWLHLPAGHQGRLPVVVQFHGYSGGRGLPQQMAPWPLAGWAHLTVDTRGQGWSQGGVDPTPDPDAAAASSHYPGSMTSGVESPQTYFYRRVYTDAVRALQVAASLEQVDPDRVLVTGGSQGGAITIAAAGLAPKAGVRLAGAMPDVPFLCDFRRSLEIASAGPYPEIEAYLKGWRGRGEQVLNTLNYFDNVHLARRAECPTLFSVALLDTVCPPSTVYAAYAEWRAEKEIAVYEYNGHEGGQAYQQARQLGWARARLG